MMCVRRIKEMSAYLWCLFFLSVVISSRLAEQATVMWKKNLERDDSRIVG